MKISCRKGIKLKFRQAICIFLSLMLTIFSLPALAAAVIEQVGSNDGDSPSAPLAEEELPKVIDHITYPDLYPDFAFSGEDDLLEIGRAHV